MKIIMYQCSYLSKLTKAERRNERNENEKLSISEISIMAKAINIEENNVEIMKIMVCIMKIIM